MNPTYDFSGRTAFVTGAARGMGLAAATGFAEAGANVALVDRDPDELETVVARFTEAGHKAIGITCDVTEESQVKQAVERAVAEFGSLDMAFNNAGIQADATELADISLDDFDHMQSINLRGIFACMKYELIQMREQESGAIVNNSSLGGFVGVPGRATYHAAKHGVHGLTKTAGLDYAARGIRVNAVAPGIIDTPMVADMKNAEEGVIEDMMRDVPIKRLGRAEEVAAAVLWLCSDASSFVVGHVIAVDGGYVAR
ncbi:SDR family NAD(P)-dependent oxidoreductase [Salinisphaera sp. Q1T1-3]|uniref:SDR family NAD(P)-dependent oxidoreductase n=1 Tax=Salinisphaera sp. Q1T1-3 TaxID=2321229 RepID=UPI000E70F0FB|nr:SDR family oxidoreductase [Salinisphaera sp. Q1T1-3]RJS94844.1 SDR family oxidoreductase [Salinisphaera sp. Q1T1-3]